MKKNVLWKIENNDGKAAQETNEISKLFDYESNLRFVVVTALVQ